MKIRKVAFIESKAPGNHIYSRYPVPRVGSVLLSTILSALGYEVKVYIEDLAKIDWQYVENSDIVCISTITPTATRAYKHAKRAQTLGIPVVMGGAHVSFMAEEALNYCDYVVRGEGDESIVELFNYLEKGSPDIKTIKGLSYRDKHGAVVNNESRPLLASLDELPIPDVSLVQDFDKSIIYPISLSRGCPFNCNFCSVIRVFGRRYRSKSIENSMAEIRKAASYPKKNIFFVDDNFTASKKRAKTLLKEMINENMKTEYNAQVRTDIAKDPELLELLAKSYCSTVYIGFESINPKTLIEYNKGQGLQEIKDCIKAVKEHGIAIHGMFVLGADNDEITTIRQTVDFAIEQGIDTIQLMILTPLPGTPFYNDMLTSGRLIHQDWAKFDAHHVTFKPMIMNPQTLHMETLKAMGRFYSWKYIFRHMAKLDFFHVAVGLYGKHAVKQALIEAKEYLNVITQLLETNNISEPNISIQ
ncbi:B12-binding domain-containing radical SAM protein [Candidatus Magnetomonas plexicatena]|uniref:B12-binding domain-containing radical SAM protein n=1 Tax=Candidatus Magnetomonas plexicatena TaxID=2552947 RepID=UPI001C74E358|nr:radical SAM protein [Nitrospirales bacterium LBB_01]